MNCKYILSSDWLSGLAANEWQPQASTVYKAAHCDSFSFNLHYTVLRLRQSMLHSMPEMADTDGRVTAKPKSAATITDRTTSDFCSDAAPDVMLSGRLDTTCDQSYLQSAQKG
ncbi:Hypp1465 [Branchiostoma lanceolatum]|uniref:Hypp1465 protein n=1 Tax=Branchiostoma lanceolatum TaxID=7740 RepID=A0A8J9ZK81_BRALA|nr:Hypp1465 [Branchiostoma lanceolatum]